MLMICMQYENSVERSGMNLETTHDQHRAEQRRAEQGTARYKLHETDRQTDNSQPWDIIYKHAVEIVSGR